MNHYHPKSGCGVFQHNPNRQRPLGPGVKCTPFGAGFGCRPIATFRTELTGRLPKAFQEGTRGGWVSNLASMEILRGSAWSGLRWAG